MSNSEGRSQFVIGFALAGCIALLVGAGFWALRQDAPTGGVIAMDENDDGTVSGDELVQALDERLETRQAAFLERFDADGDRIVTAQEAMAVHQARGKRYVDRLVNRFDADSSGFIDGNEMRSFRRSPAVRMMEGADADGDKALNATEVEAWEKSEVAKLQEQFFAQYDTDKDGQVAYQESLDVHRGLANDRKTRLLGRLDANQDGEITVGEIAANKAEREKQNQVAAGN